MTEIENWYLIEGRIFDPPLTINARTNGNIIVFDQNSDGREHYKFLRFLYSENVQIHPINEWTYSVIVKNPIEEPCDLFRNL